MDMKQTELWQFDLNLATEFKDMGIWNLYFSGILLHYQLYQLGTVAIASMVKLE